MNSKNLNLHELNKHLKTHIVSSSDFEDVIESDVKFTTPRKPKKQRESYEEWKLRTEQEQMQMEKPINQIDKTDETYVCKHIRVTVVTSTANCSLSVYNTSRKEQRCKYDEAIKLDKTIAHIGPKSTNLIITNDIKRVDFEVIEY